MDQLNDKQRRIIRLAFTSKDPDLRRRAVERVMTARYTEEFHEWADSQGEAFTRRDTGNKVKFNSLTSQEQKEVYRRYEAGEYEDKGGRAAPGGGDRDQGADDSGGGQHANRKELRGKAKKGMKDDAGMDANALDRMFPVEKLKQVEDEDVQKLIQDNILNGNLSYHNLESLQMTLQYMSENPDADYTKNHWLTKDAKLDHRELKKLNKALGKKLQDAKGRKYSDTVLEIANNNNLEGVDADALYAFRKDKPDPGYRALTPEQLKQKFLQGPWADAETKKRVQEMSAADFMAMRLAIFDDDEEALSFDVAASTRRQAKELSLFERPPGSEDTDKEASLTTVGRKIVRMAFNSKDPEVRRKLVRRARAETIS